MKLPRLEHRIRLRGPWEFLWLKPPAGMPEARRCGRLDLPATWSEEFGDATGTVRISRRFGQPTGLDDERVWLEVALGDAEASLLLNGAWLATITSVPVRIDVTGRLAERNRLDLDLVREEPSKRPLVEVALVMTAPGENA